MRMVEVCAMVDSSLFTWSTAKDFGTPCVAEIKLADLSCDLSN